MEQAQQRAAPGAVQGLQVLWSRLGWHHTRSVNSGSCLLGGCVRLGVSVCSSLGGGYVPVRHGGRVVMSEGAYEH